MTGRRTALLEIRATVYRKTRLLRYQKSAFAIRGQGPFGDIWDNIRNTPTKTGTSGTFCASDKGSYPVQKDALGHFRYTGDSSKTGTVGGQIKRKYHQTRQNQNLQKCVVSTWNGRR